MIQIFVSEKVKLCNIAITLTFIPLKCVGRVRMMKIHLLTGTILDS